MAFVNYNNKEITAKIVYYGPALSGKTTCLRYIFNCEEIENKGKLITLDTDGDRTLFFDFLPLEIGKLGNYSIKIQLYTVPGQVAYDTTRKLVLQGADGVVFVADSQMVMREQNIESFANLKKNLKLNNLQFEKIPLVFHFNKRDLKEILPVNSLNKDLNPDNKSFFPTVATSGENVLEGLYAIIKLVIIYLKNQLSIFQKDKTIMFSREEITSSTPKTKDNPALQSEPDKEKGPGDTDKEEIFELSSPMVDAEDSFKPAADDDIFDLDDAQEIKHDEADSEILEMNFEDEEYKDTDAVKVSGMVTDDGNTGDHSPNTQGKIKSIDVPITLDISKDPGNIQISLNLRLTIKKK
ncbi:MAG: GTPase domain-containing protein [Candidatus Aminicenantes bacterium]|nr:GTPase domain-containing protein [Candidatus Aminicenantes bacterium]